MTVADTFDAMTTTRPYQKAMEIDFVVDRIRQYAGARYDPGGRGAFVRAYEKGNLMPIPVRPALEEPEDASVGGGAVSPGSAPRVVDRAAGSRRYPAAGRGRPRTSTPTFGRGALEREDGRRTAPRGDARMEPRRPTGTSSSPTRRTPSCTTGSGVALLMQEQVSRSPRGVRPRREARSGEGPLPDPPRHGAHAARPLRRGRGGLPVADASS